MPVCLFKTDELYPQGQRLLPRHHLGAVAGRLLAAGGEDAGAARPLTPARCSAHQPGPGGGVRRQQQPR